MTVLKFGGTSLSTPTRIRNACKLMAQAVRERGAVAMVCSALGGVTNTLIRLAHQAAKQDPQFTPEWAALVKRHRETARELLAGEQLVTIETLLGEHFEELRTSLQHVAGAGAVDREHLDRVMSFGERLSALIISAFLAQELPATYLDARKVIRTDARFGHAQVDHVATNTKMQAWFEQHDEVAVVTGFIASSPTGETTTLGRGGSDYTAALLGAALSCDRIEIWTDVNGFMTADPNQVPEAFSPRTLTFEDALELAYLGAKVIYPPTLIPAMNANVSVLVKNCFLPNHPGTLIENTTLKPAAPITGISAISSIIEIRIHTDAQRGAPLLAATIHRILARYDVPIRLLHHQVNLVRIFLDERQSDWERVHADCTQTFNRGGDALSLHREKSLIALVGRGLGDPNAYQDRISQTLASENIELLAYGQCRSARNISLVVESAHQQRAQRLLHKAFFAKKDIQSATPASLGR